MSTKTKQFFVLVCLLAVSANTAMAQGGQAAITQATTDLAGYVDVIGDLILGIGGIVGLIGGVKVFTKWNGGDKDINKDLMAWGGSCVFLVLVSVFIKTMFGL